ncbi:g13215 [Coccomyxa viridis]|uniref:Mediator of RNA polymerase II transcription subunit 10 n=1 Tax=Coccomyxa viridis TaxID=1274662 RepID=A0ABP1GCA9_9CHLO
MSDVRKTFRQAADTVLKQIQELEASVSNYGGDPDTLIHQLEKFQKDLQTLEQKRDLLAVDVPVDLLRAIYEGGNPDVFTAEVFERANRANQLSKGKAEAFTTFRDSLLKGAETCYPSEAEAYKALLPPPKKKG